MQPVRFARHVSAVLLLLCAASLASAPTLAHLKGIEELKIWFNQNRGHPRLVLLVSPT